MSEEDIRFLFNAVLMIRSPSMSERKEWRCKEENVARLIELASVYGGEVVDAKIQQIKEVLYG